MASHEAIRHGADHRRDETASHFRRRRCNAAHANAGRSRATGSTVSAAPGVRLQVIFVVAEFANSDRAGLVRVLANSATIVFERRDDTMGSTNTQGELWGAAAERWAADQERVCRPLWLDVLDDLDANPGMHLLDAGCGAGGGSVDATSRGCRTAGIDASS